MPERKSPRRHRALLNVYVTLVVLNVLTFVLAAFFWRDLSRSYDVAIERNRRLAAAETKLFDLDELTSSEGHDDERTAGLRETLAAVRQQISLSTLDTTSLVRELDRLEARIGRQETLQHEMFAAAAAKQFERAKLASDQARALDAEMHDIISAAMRFVIGAQLQSSETHGLAPEVMTRRNVTLLALVAGVLISFVIYGRHIKHDMEAARAQAAHLAEVEDREAKLREVVAQRDGAVAQITGVYEELRTSEERFQIAAHATRDVIWEWDLHRNWVCVNNAFASSFGYKRALDFPADIWRAAIHPDDRETVLSNLRATLDGDSQFWSAQYRYATAGGEWRDVFDRGVIIRDGNGTAVRMIGTMADVTEQSRARAAIASLHRRNELILNSVAEGILGVAPEGSVRFANEAGAQMLGTTVDAILGRPITDVVHPVDGTSPLAVGLLTFTDAPSILHKETFRRLDGSLLPVEYSCRPVIDEYGEVSGGVVTFRDISERLAVERMKDEFVSTVSHELRTPLTSIRGALGLVASGRLGTLPEKGQRLLEIAASNTDRLVRLINDILDIERMELGSVTLSKTTCDVTSLLQQARDVVKSLADRERINIVTDARPGLQLVCDSDRVVQTLTNLIGNAIKFSPSGSSVRVSAARDRDDIVFTVGDRGRGIPADKLDSIFERFQQVDASDSREKGGSGLGLAICRSIVSKHGGSISVSSELGQGSTFTFTIPIGLVDVEPATDEAAKRIIVCDDDEETRDALRFILSPRGYEVIEVSNGDDVMRMAEANRPDAILLDLFMPGMNGWETLARLRSNPDLATIPVVVVSVLSPEESGGRSFEVSGWIEKPLDEKAVTDVVEGALRQKDRQARVVLVEDDADLARVISASFERYGIETIHAANGAEALDLAKEMQPDLVVLDLILPDLDGFAVVNWLKEHKLWSSVPLVIYSAMEPTPSQKEGLRLGATEFLTKSRIAPDEFEQRVVALLDKLVTTNTEVAKVA